MKTHLITTLILIGLLTLCVGMAMSYYVLMGVMGTAILVFVYSMIFTGVSRNITNKNMNDQNINEKNVKHLQWLYDRMANVYGENKDYDYMIKFKEIIEQLKK
jgi:uncharacterized membrane protein